MHLIESDAAIVGADHRNSAGAESGAGDWFVLIDGTVGERGLGGDRDALRRRRRAQIAPLFRPAFTI